MTREPEWVEQIGWWRVFPLGFVGALPNQGPAPLPGEGRLTRLEPWLDHVLALSLGGVALGPIAASVSHGYDTLDHLRLDPRLGQEADFDAFVAQAHERGLRVQLDGVFNHVARAHPQAQRALAEGPESAAMGWFKPWPLWDGSVELANFEGSDDLVEWNHESPAVRDYVVQVMRHWLDRGVDSWRLDAAYRVPTSFWAQVLPAVRESHPEVYFEAEVIHGDYAGFVAESRADTVTQYELWKAIWSAISSKNWYELDWALQRNNELLSQFVPATFLGNHDTTRIASQIVDARHRPHALVLLATLPGTPAVYAGDEFGWLARKEDRPGGDDAIRPEFPDTQPVFDALSDEQWATWRLHERLLGLRRRHPWLHRASVRAATLTNEQYVLEAAGVAGQRWAVALNLANEHLFLPNLDPASVRVVDCDDATRQAVAGEYFARERVVAPHGWAICALDG